MTPALHQNARRIASCLTLAGSALAMAASLVACGGGSDAPPSVAPAATVQLKGIAATGAAIAGASVKAVNAKGASATGTTAADGSFSINIADAAPFVLSVTDAAGKLWVSYAQAAGAVNITPLTTLAMLDANAGKPLADLIGNWGSARPTEAAIVEAAKKVNANLRTQLQAQGLDATKLNVFVDSFAANHTGLDAVLDSLRVTLNCSATACSQTITNPAGAPLITWNANIATNGISLSWTAGVAGGATGGGGGSIDVTLGACAPNPPAGSYSMIVQTSVTGFGGAAIPEVCINGLPGKPASQADFCADASFKQQLPPGVSILSCAYTDPSGIISARITSPVAIDYSVKYTFVKR